MGKDTPRWRRYLRLWGADAAADVDEEFRFHVQERVDDLMAAGLSAQAARDEALRGFGDMERVKSTCRDLAEGQEAAMRRLELWDTIRQDTVFALRQMRTHASLTLAVVLTLALGIGATTAIFSVVNAVLLRPLPNRDADRVVTVWETIGEGLGRASAGHFHDWTEQSTTLDMTTVWQARTFNLTTGDPERITGAHVTPSYFQIHYLPPAAGRYFLPAETAESRVVVLSHGLWRTRFAGARTIIGQSIVLNGEAHTVVGVAPAAFTLSEFDDRLWTPFSFAPAQRSNYGSHMYVVRAKLKTGVTIAQAQADLERVTLGIAQRYPDQMQGRGVRVESWMDGLVGGYRVQLWVLLSAVTLVLLIGCGNVASLLLARATARRKEIAIRGALGGGRRRLVAQLLTESLILAFAGGAAGLLVARLGVQFLAGMGPAWMPRLAEAGLQRDVLGFALGITLLCGLLFGLAPALRATRVDLQSALREGGRSSRGATRDRLRSALVVAELAITLVLLVSAGLFIRSALLVQRVPIGFATEGVTMMRVSLPQDRYHDELAIQSAFSRMLDHVRAAPGVRSAGASSRLPMWGPSTDAGFRVAGSSAPEGPQNVGHVRLITPGYMESLGLLLKRGRFLTEADMAPGAARAVVINETMARALFGEQDPLGQRLSGWASEDNPVWREIVGVVADTRAFGPEREAPPEIFLPYTQAPDGAWNAFQRSMAIIARSADAQSLAAALRESVRRIDPLLPAYDVQPLDEVLSQTLEGRKFNTLLLTLLGLTGLVLAAIGIYGVIAFLVSQRTHEIAVRMALGASAADVTRRVVGQALLLALAGLTVGGVASFWSTRTLNSMLFEVPLTDPFSYLGSAAVLIVVALLAALLPALRAARVQPLQSLSSA